MSSELGDVTMPDEITMLMTSKKMNYCPLDRATVKNDALHVTCSQPIRGQYFQLGRNNLFCASSASPFHFPWCPIQPLLECMGSHTLLFIQWPSGYML